jgi:DNA/RNA endonuclease G (NUC1)
MLARMDAAPSEPAVALAAQAVARRAETADEIAARTRGKGYPADWLGERIEVPTLRGVAEARLERLDYERYGVVFDRTLRICRISASGLPAAGEKIAAVRLTQPLMADPAAVAAEVARARGLFHPDPRLGDAAQITGRWYDAVGDALARRTPFDQGHMTARSQVAFGATHDDAVTSEFDSFSYANVVPQSAQSNERGQWRHVEQYIELLRNAGFRIVHFTGPVVSARDPVVDLGGDPPDRVRVPRVFWKIVLAARTGATPERAAFAFLLDDGDAVSTIVAAVREALARHRAIAAGEAEAPSPLPLPAVRWSSLREVARRAGLELGNLHAFPEPRAQGQPIASVHDVRAGAGRQDLLAPRS